MFISTLSAEAQIRLHFATQKEAEQMICEKDNYIKGWGQFDIDSRLGKNGAKRKELLNYMKSQCLEFSSAEQDSISSYFQQIMKTAQDSGFNLPLPDEIVFIKTTTKEEGGAGGYTRSNRIFMNKLPNSSVRTKAFLSHELFHVLTRNSRDFKKAMYKTIGFNLLDKEIKFGKDIINSRISNPDVSNYDSYAILTINGEKQPCTMMLQANRPYEGGSFFKYLKIGLIPLDKKFHPIVKQGKTVVYPLDQCSDFYEHVGKNTSYVINPEEALADNFCYIFMGMDISKINNPEILEAIKTVCRSFRQ